MSDVWKIERRSTGGVRGLPSRAEVLRDDGSQWHWRERDHDAWKPLEDPHDVEVFEALRALGLV